jgi:hypothetical protein
MALRRCERNPNKVRFDIAGSEFARIARRYSSAVRHAESLNRRLSSAAQRDDRSTVGKLETKLRAAEAEIDDAHSALTVHTQRTALGPWERHALDVARGVAKQRLAESLETLGVEGQGRVPFTPIHPRTHTRRALPTKPRRLDLGSVEVGSGLDATPEADLHESPSGEVALPVASTL